MHSSPPDGRIPCKHVTFPTTNCSGRWGIGRIKTALDWFLIPALALLTIWLTWRRRVGVIVTVAHGRFFIAATLAARLTSVPCVLFVHDDWIFGHAQASHLRRYIVGPVFRFVARSASHIYAVSRHMQEWLWSTCGVPSEVQLPACEPHETKAPPVDSIPNELNIVFAGTSSPANDDSLSLVVEIIKRGELKKYGIASASLIMYTTPTSDKLKGKLGRDHPRIEFRPWVTQPELPRALASADMLLLPFSFLDSQKAIVSRSFPSKLADYLAAGTPILMVGPDYADIVRYANQTGFAEVVDSNDREAVARAIARIAHSTAHRERLRAKSRQIFMQNHNIAVQRRDFYETLQRLSRKMPRRATVCASSAYGE
jgi:glycosyltransferase involved in cell wall biosynthesis